MPEAENDERVEKDGKAKGADRGARDLSMRADRALKDVDRLMKKSPETSAEQKVTVQLEQAKVSALLELADAIRSKQ
jgi:hypothetical protein